MALPRCPREGRGRGGKYVSRSVATADRLDDHIDTSGLGEEPLLDHAHPILQRRVGIRLGLQTIPVPPMARREGKQHQPEGCERRDDGDEQRVVADFPGDQGPVQPAAQVAGPTMPSTASLRRS